MRLALTSKFLEGLKGNGVKQRFSDEFSPNLVLYVQPSGTMAWSWDGRIDGVKKKISLGRYPAVSLKEARNKANAIAIDRERNRGIGDLVERRDRERRAKEEAEQIAAEAEERRASRTGQWLFQLYMENEGSTRKSAKEKWRIWNVDFKATIGSMPVDDITHEILMGIVRRKHATAPIQSRNLVAHIKRVFKWAITHGRHLTQMSVNPAADLYKLGSKPERIRFLNEFEIGCFFEAIGEMTSSSRLGLELILYTGVRQQECFAARWEEFDLTKGYWVIPAQRAKNAHEHLIPLPATMIRMLRNLHKDSGGRGFLFPKTGNGEEPRPATSFSNLIESMNNKTRRVALGRAKKAVVEHFTIHDLRRTVVSGMNGLLDKDDMPIIPSDVVERCVNHLIGGVKRTYNRHAYLAEKRRAFRHWADHLNRIRGLNVIEFPKVA